MTNSFNPNGNGGNNGSTAVRPASMAQISWYMDLCKQKQIVPQNINGMNYKELSDLINATRSIFPVTAAQKALILDMMLQANMEAPTDEFFEKLTGGRDGTASRAINELQRIVAEHTPPNEYQMDIMFRMFYCPDVNWDNYGIDTKIYLDQYMTRPKKDALGNYVVNMESGQVDTEEVQMWRQVTTEEFKNQIISTMNKSAVSKLIDECRQGFENWRNTRASKSTIDMIRQWENRMQQIYVPREVERRTDIEGVEDTDNVGGTPSEATKAARYMPVAYEPLTDASILQFTQREAEIYLNRLRDEYSNGMSVGTRAVTPDEKKNGLVNYTPTDMDLVESTRTARDQASFNAQAWNQLNDILYALCKVSGEEDIELINSGFYIFSQEGAGSKEDMQTTKEKRAYIRAYMMRCIEDNYISMDGMLQMVDRCNVAKEILFGLNNAGKWVETQSWEDIRESRKREKEIHGASHMPTLAECK